MSEIIEPIVLDRTARRILGELHDMTDSLRSISKGSKPTIYGFCIDQSLSDPSTWVTYIEDSHGFVPFTMDLTTGVPDYGSWKGAFFMPRPCMLKYNGEVDYYLDPDNFKLKEDGTASDVDDTTYSGNAMMEWPVIYVSRTQVGEKIFVRVSDQKVDDTYHCWSNHTKAGTIKPFYTPIYNGSDINGTLRSISGQAISKAKNTEAERTAVQANGSGWDIEYIADRWLINDLLILLGKSTDTQAVFGSGFIAGGNADNFKLTGIADDKGLFYGLSDQSTPIKVFGMENYWGQQWRRQLGWMYINGVHKVKMTYGTEDGSTGEGFNTTGEGYISLPDIAAYTGSSGGYIKKHKATPYGLIPVGDMSGSSTTYYCDGLWFNNTATILASVGGSSVDGVRCGAFSSALDSGPGVASWNIGASPSFKHEN